MSNLKENHSKAVQKIPYDSRDYSFKDIEPDERFVQTKKEFFITLGTYLVFAVLLIANLFVVGGTDIGKDKYVLGFPLWIFLEIVILVGMVIAVELIVSFVYKDMDITPAGRIIGSDENATDEIAELKRKEHDNDSEYNSSTDDEKVG